MQRSSVVLQISMPRILRASICNTLLKYRNAVYFWQNQNNGTTRQLENFNMFRSFDTTSYHANKTGMPNSWTNGWYAKCLLQKTSAVVWSRIQILFSTTFYHMFLSTVNLPRSLSRGWRPWSVWWTRVTSMISWRSASMSPCIRWHASININTNVQNTHKNNFSNNIGSSITTDFIGLSDVTC